MVFSIFAVSFSKNVNCVYKVCAVSVSTPVDAKSRWIGIKMDASMGLDGECQTLGILLL